MESKRQQKYSRMIQKELGAIFQRNMTHQLGSMMVSVTQVRMSPDLGLAKAYLSFILHENPDGALDQVNNHKSEIRRELGKRIGKQVRIVPEIAFLHDDSSEYATHMDKLISDLDIPEESDEEEEEK